MKKVSLTIAPLIVCACLLGGCTKDGGLQSVVNVPPTQSELLKAMEIVPEDITSVIILDDHFAEFTLTDPEDWSFLYSYDSIEDLDSSDDSDQRIAHFISAPTCQFVVLNAGKNKIEIFASEDGGILYDRKIFRPSTSPLDAARWEKLIRRYGGVVETEDKKVRGLLRHMRIWHGDIDSITITDTNVSPSAVYVSEDPKDWAFLSFYTAEGQYSEELLPELFAWPTARPVFVRAGDVEIALRILAGGEIMATYRTNSETGEEQPLSVTVFTSSSPFDNAAQEQVLASAKSQGSNQVEE